MTTVIDVRDLTKSFGDFRALDKFNLRVEQGTIHGFLGPNGSGKSTTIRVLLGVLHLTSDAATVLGEDPRRYPAVRKRIGYIPGDVSLWPSLTGREVFRALESLRGLPVDREREREEEHIEPLRLDPDKKTQEYSTGNRRKICHVAALSVGAEVLILNESNVQMGVGLFLFILLASRWRRKLLDLRSRPDDCQIGPAGVYAWAGQQGQRFARCHGRGTGRSEVPGAS